MSKGIRIRVNLRGDLATVRSIIRHPMETGFRRDPDNGRPIPAHFIEEVVCKHNQEIILRCDWSRAVSRNPYLAFAFHGAARGDTVSIGWRDSNGKSESASISI